MSASHTGLKKQNLPKNDSEKEMKEYAESTMNELLGWYGYEKMSTCDTQALNLSLFGGRSACSSRRKRATSLRPRSRILSDGSSSEDSVFTISTTLPDADGDADPASISPQSGSYSFKIDPRTDAGGSLLGVGCACCGWCGKVAPSRSFSFKTASNDQLFCSEICFSQHRRASFKRTKSCDWCRHSRHTVNYLDLHDGHNSYQFCSDKCLNQFKLDIFCQETKEHMELHPHHQEQQNNVENGGSPTALITPDLWLKDCTSPPSSDKSRTPSPAQIKEEKQNDTDIARRSEVMRKTRKNAIDKKCKRVKRNGLRVVNRKNDYKTKTENGGTHHLIRKNQHRRKVNCSSAPQIPFCPNFSSILPSVLSERSQASRLPQINNQIPPLVPITQYQLSRHASSPSPPSLSVSSTSPPPSRPPPPPPPPPPQLPSTSSSEQHSATTFLQSPINYNLKSLIPPPTVLLPYPIVLPMPLPIPIPIPIPFPIFLNKLNDNSGKHEKTTSNSNDSECVKDGKMSSEGLMEEKKKMTGCEDDQEAQMK